MQAGRHSSNNTLVRIDPEKRFHNEYHVAERLGISVNTLRRWRLLGKGPAFRKFAGSTVRYGEADLEAFVANSPIGGKPEVS